MSNNEIQKLILLLGRLPGLGQRSGRRIALHLLKKRETVLQPLIAALEEANRKIITCSICSNLDTQNPCGICDDYKRDQHSLCVVADVSDLWAFERSSVFKGTYHILGGLLSALDNVGPNQLNIPKLIQRIKQQQVTEVILALNATVDGVTTVHYLADQFKNLNVKVSTLAQGVPVGGELDYLDDGTISTAFFQRKDV